MGLKCFICLKDDIGNIKILRNHLSFSHSIRFGRFGGYNNFICNNERCYLPFSLYNSYVRHIKKSHRHLFEIIDLQIPDQENLTKDIDSLDCLLIKKASDLNMSAGNLIHFLKSNKTLTGANLKYMIEGIEKILLSMNSDINSKFQKFCEANNIAINTQIYKDFVDNIKFSSIFENLHTPYQQKKYIKDNSKYYVEPQEIILGYRIENKNVGSLTTKKLSIADTYQYISLIDTLTVLVKNPIVNKMLNSEHGNACQTEISSFLDGSKYKSHPYFIQYPNALRLQLYYDDLEVVNPLGSKTSIHKVGAFYISLQNFPSYIKHNLRFIFPVILCYTEDLKKYGFSKILKPFMKDLNILESRGIINNNNEILRGTLACICADGLAYHELCGFLSPACNKFCRKCYISRMELHGISENKNYNLRTIKKYEDDLKSGEPLTNFGIKKECILNESKFFHCTGIITFDIMHDLLEGICDYEIKLVLNHFVFNKKYFTASFFNNRVASFQYGYTEKKNKPTPNFNVQMLKNTQDKTLRQKAMQSWCLIRVFPFLIGDVIPIQDEPYMELILILLQILGIIFTPQISNDMVAYLDVLLKDHNNLFQYLFPENNKINKHHHMEHYADAIIEMGPLIQYWCMRYEGKHNEMKEWAHVCKNFKNIVKSLAQKHQISLSYHLDNIESSITYNNGENVKVCSQKIFQLFDSSHSDGVLLNKVFIFGTEYKLGLVLCIDYTDMPVFGRIENILLVNKIVHFKVLLYQTNFWHVYYNAFALTITSKYMQCTYDSLYHYRPNIIWKSYTDDFLYLSPRTLVI